MSFIKVYRNAAKVLFDVVGVTFYAKALNSINTRYLLFLHNIAVIKHAILGRLLCALIVLGSRVWS